MSRLRLALLVCLLLGGLAHVLVGDAEEERSTFAAPTIEEPEVRVAHASEDEPRERRRTPDLVEVVETPKIATVQVDPEQPCAGDQFRVTTQLHDENDESKIFVNGQPGELVVLESNEAGPYPLRILARGWDETFEHRDAVVNVRDCGVREPRLQARVIVNPIAEREYRFDLRPVPESGVVWEFGDGTTSEDSAPSHRYAPRADRPHSTYQVKATYEGPSGEETMYASVTHVEATGIAARTRFPTLESEGERFVDWDRDSGLRTRRVFRNPFPEDTRFEVAEIRGFPCNGADAINVHLPADQVLDSVHIDAESEQEVEVHVPADTFDLEVCRMLVRTAGLLGDRTVTDAFALDTGLPDEREPIDDPVMLAQLREYSTRHGNGPITPAALDRD